MRQVSGRKLFGRGNRNVHLFTSGRHRKRCSAAAKREGAARCAAPVGVFLGLAELLRARTLWMRFKEDIHHETPPTLLVIHITVDPTAGGE